MRERGRIVGWAFLMGFDKDVPHLGIAVADDQCGKGHGRRLMEDLIGTAREAGKTGIELIHAKLGDLMLAKALEGTAAEQITRPGQLVGELAPEPKRVLMMEPSASKMMASG